MATTTKDTTEQATRAWGAANELLWDTWTQSLGMFTWAGEQTEKLLTTWVEQGRLSREEGLRMQQAWVEQARTNQRELQAMVTQSVNESTETFRNTFQQQMEDMRARVETLNEELRAYRENAATR